MDALILILGGLALLIYARATYIRRYILRRQAAKQAKRQVALFAGFGPPARSLVDDIMLEAIDAESKPMSQEELEKHYLKPFRWPLVYRRESDAD